MQAIVAIKLLCIAAITLGQFGYAAAYSQVSDPPEVTSFKRFDLNDGLPALCVEDIHVDRKGRLWVNPCRHISFVLGLNFYQYDATQSIDPTFSEPWAAQAAPGVPWSVFGETTNGFLFGADRFRSVIFYWNPDTQELYQHPLDSSVTLLNAIADNDGGVLVLTRDERTYDIHRLAGGSSAHVSSLDLDFDEDIRMGYPYPLAVANDQLWFYHQFQGLVTVDLVDGNAEFTPWSAWPELAQYRWANYDNWRAILRYELFAQGKDHLFLYLGQLNGFFSLDLKTGELTTEKTLNDIILLENVEELWLRLYMAQDRRGSLFIQSGYVDLDEMSRPEENYQAILLDKDSQLFDYTPILEQSEYEMNLDEVDPHYEFFSADFKRELGWSSPVGIYQLQLQPHLGISNTETPYGLRTIKSLDSNTLIANADVGGFMVDLTDMSYDQFLRGDVYLGGLSPIVSIGRDTLLIASKANTASKTGDLLWYDLRRELYTTSSLGVDFEVFTPVATNTIALVSNDGRLYLYDVISETLELFKTEGKSFVLEGGINEMLFTDEGLLWLGCSQGLYKIDIGRATAERHELPEFSTQPNILCLHEGENGLLWCGTAKHGVLIVDPHHGVLKEIKYESGHTQHAITGIVADEQLNRWVSTFSGITVVTKDGEVMFDLSQRQGLINDEFNRASYARLMDKRIAFGGIRGLDVLDPERIRNILSKTKPLHIYLTQVAYFDMPEAENLEELGAYNNQSTIVIPAGKRYLRLDFSLSEYNNLAEHKYGYRLVPQKSSVEEIAEIPWSNLGSQSEVTLNNLPVGEYFVQVRGMDHMGVPASNILEVPIEVQQLFYRTWWFYLLCSTPFIIFAFVWWRRNVTERKRLKLEVNRRTATIMRDKETIEKQARKLRQLDQAKTRLFTNISHEFRTPLTVILGMLDQIKGADRTRALIKRNATYLLLLVNQILDLQKLESGKLKTSFIQGDVVSYFKYVVESIRSIAEDKGVSLDFESTDTSLILDYDPEKMLYIISNLLSNAIKFTSPGGEVVLSLKSDGGGKSTSYQLSVRDSGVGIDTEHLSHIFDRFYQVDDRGDNTRQSQGTGIGLALVKELVDLLDGHISVESTPGKGTIFTIQLPISREASRTQMDQDRAWGHVPHFTPIGVDSHMVAGTDTEELPTLLIVEDSHDVMEYITVSLQGSYKVYTARDGQEGVDWALEHVPDIVVSDVMMPRLNGFGLCDTLKNDVRTSHIPIVLLTAKADLESRVAGLESGADAYLSKPFDKRQLTAQLHNLLVQRQKLRKRYSDLGDLEVTTDPALQKEDEFITSLRKMILDNMTEEGFGVPALCKLIGMSRTQLHNKIKSLTQMSTSQFVRAVRIQKAKELLHDTTLTISEVAFEVGIDSLPYFSKIFSEESGLSPSKYREKHLI